MEKVYIDRLDNYDLDNLKSSIIQGINLLGGMEKFFKNNDKVLIKANLLMKRTPQEATTTHPNVIEAFAKILIDYGCSVIIGDSPGGPFNERALKGIYKTTGMEEVSLRTGAELNSNFDQIEIYEQENKLLKRITKLAVISEVDKIVNIGKLKTHSMTVYTGAVKNMFGTVPGILKAQYHFTMPNIDEFSDMLIDVCQSSKPTLSLIDGIIGMEGAGPSAGEPRHLGALLISDNPYELDVVGCSLIGIPLDKVATIVASKNRGYTKMDINNIDFVNMNLEEFGTVQFKRPHSGGLGFIKGKFPRIISQRIEKIVLAKPTFDEKICVKCGECERACPPGAITMGEIVPIVDLNKCIRCFCCQELCSFKAVKVKSNKIVDKILRL